MMKKWIILMMIGLIIMSGCKKESAVPDLPEMDYNIEGERVVLFNGGNKQFPISFTVDGKQKIQNSTYFYYDLNNQFNKEWSDSFYLYDFNKLELTDLRQYGLLGKQELFATNGNWPLFLNPVHTEYSVSTQKQAPANLLKCGNWILKQNGFENEPLIIKDVWLCDMDSDGDEEQFFKATNFSYPSDEKSDKALTKDEIRAYMFLAYADGEECQLLSGSFRSLMNEHQDKEAATVISSFYYDDKGEIATTVLKRRQGPAFLRDLRPMICDPDGDKRWSVLLYKEADFKSLTLMDFSNGSFIKNYEVIF